MTIHLNLANNSYDITVERGILKNADKHFNLNRRVLIVTDSGVPEEYAKTVLSLSKYGVIYTVDQGENSKSLEVFTKLLQTMLDHGFSRKDCVVAVGGGVVGDLAGFAASAYMRGIDFYNIPTTLLSQIDSSIGGKTAVNLGNIKNVVGAFYQPKGVLIDSELLNTLPKRQISNGLAEAIKVALTFDSDLFDIIENGDIEKSIDEIIIRSLKIKKSVVEKDEKESGLRRVLNFGHTVGHGIEVSQENGILYHGECVALGIIPMCNEKIRPRVTDVLKKYNLVNKHEYDWEKIKSAVMCDKKADGETVTIITVDEIGNFKMSDMPCCEIVEVAKNVLENL
jgi:3-dehydroquinate synthase